MIREPEGVEMAGAEMRGDQPARGGPVEQAMPVAGQAGPALGEGGDLGRRRGAVPELQDHPRDRRAARAGGRGGAVGGGAPGVDPRHRRRLELERRRPVRLARRRQPGEQPQLVQRRAGEAAGGPGAVPGGGGLQPGDGGLGPRQVAGAGGQLQDVAVVAHRLRLGQRQRLAPPPAGGGDADALAASPGIGEAGADPGLDLRLRLDVAAGREQMADPLGREARVARMAGKAAAEQQQREADAPGGVQDAHLRQQLPGIGRGAVEPLPAQRREGRVGALADQRQSRLGGRPRRGRHRRQQPVGRPAGEGGVAARDDQADHPGRGLGVERPRKQRVERGEEARSLAGGIAALGQREELRLRELRGLGDQRRHGGACGGRLMM